MKLGQLRKVFKNKYSIRIVSGVLVVTMLGTGLSANAVYAAKQIETVQTQTDEDEDVSEELKEILTDNIDVEVKDVDKEETVYVIADNTGAAKETIVSAWLKNKDGKDTLTDASSLTGIENVKGDETFTQSGEKITWKADGNDIYYQGKTTKEAPVTEKITYYLDDKEVSADEIAGKSGKVRIRFDYNNNAKISADINGEKEDVYVPFVVVSGMALGDNFTNIEVTNGKVISNGSGNMVVGMAMPGIRDSLDIEEDVDSDVKIPDYVEVTADVEDFSLDMTMSFVTSSSSLNIDDTFDFSEVDEKIDDLSDGVEQLKDGSGELADGAKELSDKVSGEFLDGVGTLQNGVKDYTDGAQKLADGIGTLKESSGQLIAGVGQLGSSVSTLANGVQVLDEAVNTKMTDKQKTAAKKQAEASVLAQLNSSKNENSLANIKKTATAQFGASIDSQKVAAAEQAKQGVVAQKSAIEAQVEAEAMKPENQQATAEALSPVVTAVSAGAQMGYVAANKDQVEAQAQANAAAVMKEIQGGASVANTAEAPKLQAVTIDGVELSGMTADEQAATKEQMRSVVSGAISSKLAEAGVDEGTIQEIVNAVADGCSSVAVSQVEQKTAQHSETVNAKLAETSEKINQNQQANQEAVNAAVAQSGEVALAETNSKLAKVAQHAACWEVANSDGAKAFGQQKAQEATTQLTSTSLATAKQAAVSGAVGVAGTVAEGVLDGVKANASTVGDSVAGAVKTASLKVAGEAAVGGAESAKQLIASSIEKKDAKSGHSLVSGMKALDKAVSVMNGKMPTLEDGIGQLSSGSQTLVSNNDKLNNGVSDLKDGTNKLADGAKKLADGAKELADGVVKLDEEGIEKLIDSYNGDIKEIVDRIQAVMDAGCEYETFSGKAEDAVGTVKFIIKTEPVKADEE